jgi:hypothetical protein
MVSKREHKNFAYARRCRCSASYFLASASSIDEINTPSAVQAVNAREREGIDYELQCGFWGQSQSVRDHCANRTGMDDEYDLA